MNPSESSYAIINTPSARIYCESQNNDRFIPDTRHIKDEALYGYAVRLLDETAAGGYVRILTHYGLTGFIDPSALKTVTAAEVLDYLKEKLKVTDAASLDVLSAPSADAQILVTLTRGSLIRSLEEETIILPEGRFALEDVLSGNVPGGKNYTGDTDRDSKTALLPPEGWARVRLLDGEGYVPSHFLAQKYFTETYLFADLKDIPGNQAAFSFQAHLNHHFVGMELLFRQYLLEEAMKYTGTQYRSGGRSASGIDSAGLIMTAYMRCGVTISREPVFSEGWPLKEIGFEKDGSGLFSLSNLEDPEFIRPGDVLYFVTGKDGKKSAAMYIGGGHYIYSSDAPEQYGVVMNSLFPDAPDYREDLHRGLKTVAGIRI